MMKNFLDYLYTSKPSFRDQKFKGASQNKIDQLESLVIEHNGVKLPKIYKDFLKIFGHDSDVLGLCPEGSTDIDHVIEFYTEDILYDYEIAIPGVIRISTCGGIPEERVLGLNCQSKPEEPSVVDIDFDDISGVLSDSFENFLFQTVEVWNNYSQYSKCLDFKGGVKDKIASLNQFLTKIGYEELSFSDSIRPWFKNESSVISCSVSSKSEHVDLHIQYNSSDIIELNILEEFLLSIGMYKSQYRERLGNNRKNN